MKIPIVFEINALMKNLSGFIGKIGQTFKWIANIVKDAFKFDKPTAQFKVLMGSIEAAKHQVEALREIAATGEFQFKQLAEASQIFMRFTSGALGGAESMRTFANYASATGSNLNTLARQIGKLWELLEQGDAVDAHINRMITSGTLTKEFGEHVKELANAGASFGSVWAEVNEQFSKYNELAGELTSTAAGQIDSINKKIEDLKRGFGQEIGQSIVKCSADIKSVLDGLQPIIKIFGGIVGWTVKIFSGLGKGITDVFRAIGFVYDDVMSKISSTYRDDKLAENIEIATEQAVKE